jgi:hypothetical protein
MCGQRFFCEQDDAGALLHLPRDLVNGHADVRHQSGAREKTRRQFRVTAGGRQNQNSLIALTYRPEL